ncbi:MAG: HNH endonuclease [Rhodobacteraceae bacterium]|nr:HNH endonuclease [Paracoccaceae bacterium]
MASDKTIEDIASAKKRIAELSYSSIYAGAARERPFAVNNYCGVHSALLHLAAPDKYESIISKSHKQRITKVFEHLIYDRPEVVCREQKIRLTRERLFEEYGDDGNPDYKYRWFFYLDRVKSLWIGKGGVSQQLISSIDDEVRREQLAQDHSEEEGKKEPTTGYRVYRSAKLVAETKKRDNFTCRACQFNFKNKIVHVHHLNPLSERQSPKETTLDDLVTLCPNCHYVAHFWLRKNSKYKNLEDLLQKLEPTRD